MHAQALAFPGIGSHFNALTLLSPVCDVDKWERHFHRLDMAISLQLRQVGAAMVIRVKGRLDAYGTEQIAKELTEISATSVVVITAEELTYLSSAGIRILIQLHKTLQARGGRLMLAGLQPYCREVVRVAGLEAVFSIFETVEAALAESGVAGESHEVPCGRMTIQQGSAVPGSVEVLGDIEDVLWARVTTNQMVRKAFSAKAYSLGLGGMGAGVDEVLPIMGEMMTMGGTMVWLPTDGNDTPDFLVPRRDSDHVVIHTGYNLSFPETFNEYIEFDASSPRGATLAELYRALFDLAKARRPDYRGALALAMRAEIGEVHGGGVKFAPIATHAPKNGLRIIDPSNYGDWFEITDSARHRDVTGLICGIGLDLQADYSSFNPESLQAAFYLNPGNTERDASELLHNHGVFFHPYPLGEKPWSLEGETARVVDEGDFIDMRHLFDHTTILWALIGVVYVQDFCRDPEET